MTPAEHRALAQHYADRGIPPVLAAYRADQELRARDSLRARLAKGKTDKAKSFLNVRTTVEAGR